MKGDSFTVDMEPFTHLTNKELHPNSRIIKSLSRKESQKGSDKKMNTNCAMNDGNGDVIYSPKEKLMLLDQTNMSCPQVHHQITIVTGSTTATTTTSAMTIKSPVTPTKSSVILKRSRSFKQSSIISPRRILMFFATLSSLGTVVLICLTLSMSRFNEDDTSHA
ncbi:hypothetical protein R6Q57_015784 [Mikania cordata]